MHLVDVKFDSSHFHTDFKSLSLDSFPFCVCYFIAFLKLFSSAVSLNRYPFASCEKHEQEFLGDNVKEKNTTNKEIHFVEFKFKIVYLTKWIVEVFSTMYAILFWFDWICCRFSQNKLFFIKFFLVEFKSLLFCQTICSVL